MLGPAILFIVYREVVFFSEFLMCYHCVHCWGIEAAFKVEVICVVSSFQDVLYCLLRLHCSPPNMQLVCIGT